MPSRTCGSLSMHSTVVPSSRPRSTRGELARRLALTAPRSTAAPRPRSASRGPAPSAGRSCDRARAPMRSTIERPRPRPRATLAPSSSRWNSRKIDALLRRRNAEPGVVDVDAQLAAAAPAADQHAALRRVFDRVGDEVLQQPPQQPPVGAHGERAGHEFEIEALLARQRREFDLELAQHFVDAEADELRPHRAGVEPRNVEQRAEDLLDRFERGIDVADQPRRPRRRVLPLRAAR